MRFFIMMSPDQCYLLKFLSCSIISLVVSNYYFHLKSEFTYPIGLDRQEIQGFAIGHW